MIAHAIKIKSLSWYACHAWAPAAAAAAAAAARRAAKRTKASDANRAAKGRHTRWGLLVVVVVDVVRSGGGGGQDGFVAYIYIHIYHPTPHAYYTTEGHLYKLLILVWYRYNAAIIINAGFLLYLVDYTGVGFANNQLHSLLWMCTRGILIVVCYGE